MKETEIKYWIWFSKLRKIENLKKHKLLEKYKNPKEMWTKSKKDFEKDVFLKPQDIDELVDEKHKSCLEEYISYMKNNGMEVITLFDNTYPRKLKKIYDSPICLYIKGKKELLNDDGIAIIGARECSDYGKNTALEISYNVAKCNKCVISGLARGIDKYAHIGALKSGGKTIGIIGSGLDNIYPSENKLLAEKIVENGGLLVSEYVIGTKVEKMNFPERNRIISGLSDGIVVIEAKEKSGTLITVDFGIEQGKEIFAVPGNINCANSIGTNNLIKEGANMVTSYKDIINVCYNNYNY